MMQFTDATGLFGNALALTVVAARVAGLAHLVPAWRRGAVLVVFTAALLPLGGLPLAGYLRGAIGDLSIPSLLLLGASLMCLLGPQPRGNPARSGHRGQGAWWLAAAPVAAVFYPLALGWGGFDPYRLGYGSYGLLAGLLLLALGALARAPMLATAIALAALAWSVGWYESTNLWDYLLDPLVSAYAGAALAWRGVRRLRGRAWLQ